MGLLKKAKKAPKKAEYIMTIPISRDIVARYKARLQAMGGIPMTTHVRTLIIAFMAPEAAQAKELREALEARA